MIKVKVNNKVVEVPEGTTVMQACEAAGEEIPKIGRAHVRTPVTA